MLQPPIIAGYCTGDYCSVSTETSAILIVTGDYCRVSSETSAILIVNRICNRRRRRTRSFAVLHHFIPFEASRTDD